jgi:hypothetical protein
MDDLERDLAVYLRSPRLEDYRAGPVLRRIREAAERDEGVTLTLDRREVHELAAIFQLGDGALRIVRELAAETWKLPGMAKLRDRRRDEITAGNYLSLRAGGLSGDGRVRLQRPDEYAAGEPSGACFVQVENGGPLDPPTAVEALAEFEGVPWPAMLKRLQRARKRLGDDFAPWDQDLAALPSARQDPTG